MSEFTEGPWEADEWATGWTVSAPESHYSVCHLEDCNNAEANARLIAAAPDLLESLTRLANAAAARENTMGDPCNLIAAREELTVEIRAARAAVAKVRGK